MTTEIACAQCSRRAGVDDGLREWFEVRSIASDPTLRSRDSDSTAPGVWAFCSPACLSVWSMNLAKASSTPPDLAPAGLYLG